MAAPIIGRSQFRNRADDGFAETTLDVALNYVLTRLSAHGVGYDAEIAVVDDSALREALSDGRGVLAIGRHGRSSLVTSRVFHDRGRQVVTIAEAAESAKLGGLELDGVLHPSNGYLLRVRSHLRQGKIVCALVDRAAAATEADREFFRDGTRIVVSEALIRVAMSCGVRILFATAHAGPGAMQMTIRAPRVESTSATDIASEFADFIAEDMRLVRAETVDGETVAASRFHASPIQ
jgi:lauroyl/myristoyl acyltransferase